MGLEIEENDIASFIANTLKLLRREEESISSAFGPLSGKCQKCDRNIFLKPKYVHQISSNEIDNSDEEVCITQLLKKFFEPYAACLLYTSDAADE